MTKNNKKIKLKGLTASLGIAEGRVIFLKKQKDLLGIKDDSIIVTDKITTEYTIGFARARAVIASKGGVTCHAAILCRELKKPCVVGCGEVFNLLKDGERIIFNADNLSVDVVDS